VSYWLGVRFRQALLADMADYGRK